MVTVVMSGRGLCVYSNVAATHTSVIECLALYNIIII